MSTTRIGKVSPTIEGTWSASKAYSELSVVEHDHKIYISKKDIPSGVSPSDGVYWYELVNASDAMNAAETAKEYLAQMQNITVADPATSDKLDYVFDALEGVVLNMDGELRQERVIRPPDSSGAYVRIDAIHDTWVDGVHSRVSKIVKYGRNILDVETLFANSQCDCEDLIADKPSVKPGSVLVHPTLTTSGVLSFDAGELMSLRRFGLNAGDALTLSFLAETSHENSVRNVRMTVSARDEANNEVAKYTCTPENHTTFQIPAGATSLHFSASVQLDATPVLGDSYVRLRSMQLEYGSQKTEYTAFVRNEYDIDDYMSGNSIPKFRDACDAPGFVATNILDFAAGNATSKTAKWKMEGSGLAFTYNSASDWWVLNNKVDDVVLVSAPGGGYMPRGMVVDPSGAGIVFGADFSTLADDQVLMSFNGSRSMTVKAKRADVLFGFYYEARYENVEDLDVEFGGRKHFLANGESLCFEMDGEADVPAVVMVAVATKTGAAVQDVAIGGNSIVQDGVAEIPIANRSEAGVVKLDREYMVSVDRNGSLCAESSTEVGFEYMNPNAFVSKGILDDYKGDIVKNALVDNSWFDDYESGVVKDKLGITDVPPDLEGKTNYALDLLEGIAYSKTQISGDDVVLIPDDAKGYARIDAVHGKSVVVPEEKMIVSVDLVDVTVFNSDDDTLAEIKFPDELRLAEGFGIGCADGVHNTLEYDAKTGVWTITENVTRIVLRDYHEWYKHPYREHGFYVSANSVWLEDEIPVSDTGVQHAINNYGKEISTTSADWINRGENAIYLREWGGGTLDEICIDMTDEGITDVDELKDYLNMYPLELHIAKLWPRVNEVGSMHGRSMVMPIAPGGCIVPRFDDYMAHGEVVYAVDTEGPKLVRDVTVDGGSIVDENGNANIPLASGDSMGLFKPSNGATVSNGWLTAQTYTALKYPDLQTYYFVSKGTLENIKSDLVRRAMSTPVSATNPEWTGDEKAAARKRINASRDKQFELIADITLDKVGNTGFLVEYDSTGNHIELEEAYVLLHFPSGSKPSTSFYVRYYGDNGLILSSYMFNPSNAFDYNSVYISHVYNNNGIWADEHSTNAVRSGIEYGYYAINTSSFLDTPKLFKNTGCITRINPTCTVAGGCRYEIYGVRA